MLTLRRKRGESILIGDGPVAAILTFRGFGPRGWGQAVLDVDLGGAVAPLTLGQGEPAEVWPGVRVSHEGHHSAQVILGFEAPLAVRIERSEAREARTAGLPPGPGSGGPCPNIRAYACRLDALRGLAAIRRDRGDAYARGRHPARCPRCDRYHLSRPAHA